MNNEEPAIAVALSISVTTRRFNSNSSGIPPITFYRLLENNNRRILENGNVRITE